MKRLLAISLTLCAALLTGCVVTPAYRYGGGHAGYYYGGSTRAYGDGYYDSYDGYYSGPWVPYAGASLYYYGHDGYGYRDRDGYRDGYRRTYQDHRSRLSGAVRDAAGPRYSAPSRNRLAQPRPAARAQQRLRPSEQHARSRRDNHHRRHD